MVTGAKKWVQLVGTSSWLYLVTIVARHRSLECIYRVLHWAKSHHFLRLSLSASDVYLGPNICFVHIVVI